MELMSKKLSRALTKRILENISELEDLKCQKYSNGKCRDFSGINPELCCACEIREGALIMKKAAERYNPHQIIF